MAHSGFHGLVAGKVAEWSASSRVAPQDTRTRGNFLFGMILGNVLPDIDLIPLAITFLFNSELAMKMHRTATHSLLVIATLTLIGYRMSKNPSNQSMWLGFGLGAVMHSALDILIWFSPVDLLWPLGNFGVPSQINLWSWVHLPRFWGNILGAFDYFFFATFFLYLYRLGMKYETVTRILPRLRTLATLHFVMFLAYVSLSFTASRSVFEIAQYAVFVLFSFPLTVWAILASRPTIERLAAVTSSSR